MTRFRWTRQSLFCEQKARLDAAFRRIHSGRFPGAGQDVTLEVNDRKSI
ncbi:MAG: hypothetical protein P4K94_07025 [Terracidiphilus sp.]|nr:hypothetical protein [Terracidiphilus sp.]